MLQMIKLLQLALLTHHTSAQMTNLLSSATVSCTKRTAYQSYLNDGGQFTVALEYSVSSTEADSDTYCQFDMGSSQSVQSVYMHQSTRYEGTVAIYVTDNAFSTYFDPSASECYRGNNEGIVDCAGTGQYLTFAYVEVASTAFEFTEVFAWN